MVVKNLVICQTAVDTGCANRSLSEYVDPFPAGLSFQLFHHFLVIVYRLDHTYLCGSEACIVKHGLAAMS